MIEEFVDVLVEVASKLRAAQSKLAFAKVSSEVLDFLSFATLVVGSIPAYLFLQHICTSGSAEPIRANINRLRHR